MSPRTLLIEGWRSIPHSYAIVNQFHCLELLRHSDIRLRHHDMPYFRSWSPVSGLFTPKEEASLRAIPALTPGEISDAVLRMTFPYDFSPSATARTLVFGTAEFHAVPESYLAGGGTLRDALGRSDTVVVTPSAWSRQGFINSGAEPDRVLVVPHGFDERLFVPPTPEERTELRRNLKLDGFVFLNIGAMTGNKGVGPLLKAFAAVAAQRNDVWLLAKGLDALYGSRESVQAMLGQDTLLTQAEMDLVRSRLLYVGRTLSFAEMACLFKAADAYVTPYLAEGFNMPAMEAAACGLPVICTRGGPTDDFVTDDFALRIDADLRPFPNEISFSGCGGSMLYPRIEHLTALMMEVVERPAIAERARATGPSYLREHFTWRHVVNRLLDVVFPQ